MTKQLPENQSIDDIRLLVSSMGSSAGVSEAEAEQTIALEYGFATWRQLEAYITHPAGNSDFLQLSCLIYFTTDRPANRERARAMLDADPLLASQDIWSAACVGDVSAVARFLDVDATLVNKRGGYFDWQPLLYACYSRLNLPDKSTLAVAELLIDRGADPNSHYMWGGQYRFTALTGAFGEGEMGPVNQSPHEECKALASLLLAAGANPNDSQALYNTMFTPGSDCLAMLLDHGLGPDHKCNWLDVQDGEFVDKSEQTLGYQLGWAVRNHYVERARLLIDHGADLKIQTDDGKTWYEMAWLAGHPDLARYLADHGAETVELDSIKRLIGACMSRDVSAAKALVENEPDLVERVQHTEPNLLTDAAGSNQLEAVRVMADLGFNLGQLGNTSPLHQAAFHGYLDMVELLLTKGADLGIRDRFYSGTPLQWAITAGSSEVVTYLASREIGVFDAIIVENLDRLTTLLDADPGLLETTIRVERSDPEPHDTDWQTPLAFAVLYKCPSAVELLLGRGARIDIANDDGKSLTELVLSVSTEEIARMFASVAD